MLRGVEGRGVNSRTIYLFFLYNGMAKTVFTKVRMMNRIIFWPRTKNVYSYMSVRFMGFRSSSVPGGASEHEALCSGRYLARWHQDLQGRVVLVELVCHGP